MPDNVFVFKYLLIYLLIQVYLTIIYVYVSRSPYTLSLKTACLVRFLTSAISFNLNKIAPSFFQRLTLMRYKMGFMLSAVVVGYPCPIPARSAGAYASGVFQCLENIIAKTEIRNHLNSLFTRQVWGKLRPTSPC